MRTLFICLSIAALAIACEKEELPAEIEQTGIEGSYRLVEVLMDPGDGSGTFQPVTSDKIVEFHSGGTVTSNGIICNTSIATDSATTGTFNMQDSSITSTCQKLYFELSGNELQIQYPCIEPCISKYMKL